MNKQRRKLTKRQRYELAGLFSLIALSTFLISITLVALIAYGIVCSGMFNIVDKNLPGAGRLIVIIALLSVIFNLVLVVITGKMWLNPVQRLINGMKQLAAGDYSARMTIGKPFGDMSVLRAVSDSFNTMAEELENTEVLRSDFINNFSHEFKTPIVSIAGFAKLLKRGNLTQQQKEEYIGIIEEESLRLSYMATNVLNLTKIENQVILTDVSTYNLSEQLRSCILLLENKWTKKNIEMYIDFGEYDIMASEELLKHVWINLLDNAIKFSPEYGVVVVRAEAEEDFVTVVISNTGEAIKPEIQQKIFNKFYQADESHSSEGNGIGLAIVKRVVDLHSGAVTVESKDSLTSFTVKLPKLHKE